MNEPNFNTKITDAHHAPTSENENSDAEMPAEEDANVLLAWLEKESLDYVKQGFVVR